MPCYLNRTQTFEMSLHAAGTSARATDRPLSVRRFLLNNRQPLLEPRSKPLQVASRLRGEWNRRRPHLQPPSSCRSLNAHRDGEP